VFLPVWWRAEERAVPARGAPVNGARAPVGCWPGRAGGKGKEGEEKKKRREKEKEKEKEGRKRKRKKEGEKEKKKEKKREGKIGKKIFGKIRKIVRENWEGFCGVCPGFSGVGAFSGTAVMARRTGRRDRGVRGILGRWPTAALGRRAMVRPRCGAGGIRSTRAGEREREKTVARV
jgi:hypothetical protein